MRILAIDPGNLESAYVVLDGNLRPLYKEKTDNYGLLNAIECNDFDGVDYIAIEMIASYGMSVGQEVFDTCVWIGRFYEVLKHVGKIKLIYRKEEKMNLCNTMKAKDSNIIQALIDRFAPGVQNKGKGHKASPGWFYGFSKDIWQAYAVGVTFYDLHIKEVK
ncbi:MAG: hypothetical protein Q8936_24205 [Bacillota bacterium]|nr:hypothetical protein [Bacillota bacterium]